MSTPTTQSGRTEQAADPFRLGWRLVPTVDPAGPVRVVQVPLTLEDVLHPLDGDYIVSNEYHSEDCIYLRNALHLAINGLPQAKVFRENHIDFGLPGVNPLVPDIALFTNVSDERDRQKTYHYAGTGAKPELIIEITSPSTRSIDLTTKPLIYAKAAVPVYAIVDYWPELDERGVSILGYQLTPAGYVRMPVNERGWLWLDIVKLWLGSEGDRVACYDEKGDRAPTHEELGRGIRQRDDRIEEMQGEIESRILAQHDADRRLEQEVQARKDAEQKAADLAAKYAELEAELRRLRGDSPG